MSSSSTNIADSNPIEMYIINLGQIYKSLKKISLLPRKALSTLSIHSLDNPTVFNFLGKLKLININLATIFFRFTVDKDDNMKDLLQNIFKFMVIGLS